VGMAKGDSVSYSTYLYEDLGGMCRLSYATSRLGLERNNLTLASCSAFSPDVTLLWDNGQVRAILNDNGNAR